MFGTIVLSELIGTGLLTLLGCGVVANAVLAKNKGFGGGFLMINFGWGLAVMCGIIVAARTGAHINPAVTFGVLATGADSYASGIPVTAGNTLAYLIGQFAGAFLGAVLAWAAYRDQFDHPDSEPAAKLGTFSTGPEIRKPVSNLVTEIIGTFVLVFVILGIGQPANVSAMQDGATLLGASAFLVVPLLVVGIGASLGGPTGYAINPARDLGPRIAHAVLPIRRKGSSDWGYSWIPVVGPLIGGVLAGLVAGLVNFV